MNEAGEKRKLNRSDDAPQLNPWTDDKLGYATTAEAIAKAVIETKVPNGYVIGLHGPWGSGKSTMANFILAYIKKHNEEHPDRKVIHVDYRPWLIAGHQDLIASYFKILSETITPRQTLKGKIGRRVLRFFRQQTDSVADAAGMIALTIDPSSGAGTKVATNLFKTSLGSALDKLLETPSLQRSYEILKKKLRSNDYRIIVTVDDIDRLDDDEVKTVLQLVKSVGQLPNVTYLLCYDRDIVRHVLAKSGHPKAVQFAEKIVQQEIDLPVPPKSSLLKLLDDDIDFLVGQTESSTRWQYIVRDGIRRWINTPRDVKRLGNGVKFLWPSLRGELDPQDLLALEGLKLFEPDVYLWIRSQRDFLFNEGVFILGTEEHEKASLSQLLDKLPRETRESTLQVLSVLFPRRGKEILGRDYFSQEDQADVISRRGIGSEAGFDAYFGFGAWTDIVPKQVIDGIFGYGVQAETVSSILEMYMAKKDAVGNRLIESLLDELNARYQSMKPPAPSQQLLVAVLSLGDQFYKLPMDRGGSGVSPKSQAIFLVRNLLAAWSEDEAETNLGFAFHTSSALGFLSEVFIDRGEELGIFRSNTFAQPTLTIEAFEKIGLILAEKIEKAVEAGTLAGMAGLYYIVRAWAHTTTREAVRHWLSTALYKDIDSMVDISQAFVYYTVGTNPRKYSWHGNPNPEIFDEDVLLAAATQHLVTSQLTDDNRALLETVKRGLTKEKAH